MITECIRCGCVVECSVAYPECEDCREESMLNDMEDEY